MKETGAEMTSVINNMPDRSCAPVSQPMIVASARLARIPVMVELLTELKSRCKRETFMAVVPVPGLLPVLD